jgi:Flp pilus assembly protein CpaB
MSTPSQPFPSTPPQGFGPAPRQVTPGPAASPTQVAGPGKAKRQRSNSTSGRRFGVIGIVLAALTFLVLLFALTTSAAPDKVYVLRATQNLTPGVVVASENLEAAPVDPEAVEPGAITASTPEELIAYANGESDDPEKSTWEVVGKTPLYPVFQGQQIRAEMFTTTAANIGSPLAPGERLVSITADVDKALAGYFKAGDVVDVMAANQDGDVVLVAEGARIVSVQADISTLRSAQQRQAEDGGKDLVAGEVLPSQPIPGIYVLRVDAATAASLVSTDELRLYLLARGTDATPAPAVANRFTALCDSILPKRIAEAENAADEAAARAQLGTYCTTPQP